MTDKSLLFYNTRVVIYNTIMEHFVEHFANFLPQIGLIWTDLMMDDEVTIQNVIRGIVLLANLHY